LGGGKNHDGKIICLQKTALWLIPNPASFGIIPREVIRDPFDGDKSVHSARRSAKRDAGYRASAATTPRDVFGPAKPGFLRPLEQRYDPLVVNQTTAWIVPCQQTQKAGQTSQGLLSLVLHCLCDYKPLEILPEKDVLVEPSPQRAKISHNW